MKNVRTMALSAESSRRIAKTVERLLDGACQTARVDMPSEDSQAIRLQVADAARRWAACVDAEEFPDDDWDEEPTQPGKRRLPLPAPPDRFGGVDG